MPMDPRKKPAAVKIHVSSGAGVDITWADGHASHYEFAYLRDQCPCATCKDERDKKQDFAGSAPVPSAALPMFKPRGWPQIVPGLPNSFAQWGHGQMLRSWS